MSTDILPTPSEMDAPSRQPFPLRWVLSGVVILLVLALIAGVTVAVRGLSGGGSQPEDALPSGAFAFAKVDLDPSAGQKINAIRFLRKFPALRDKIGLDADLRESLFEGVAESAGWDDLSFDEDVAPWLGQRIGIAAYPPADGDAPGGGELPPDLSSSPVPTIVVALQVTDAEKAREGLDRLNDSASVESKPGVVVRDGYALLAQDQPTADRAAQDAARSVLADDSEFSSDLGALGDGVASAWINMDAMASFTGLVGVGALGLGGLNPASSAGTGRTSYVLRFDGADALEVRGAATGARSLVVPEQPLRGFTELPVDSVVAFGLAGGNRLVPGFFDSLRQMFSAQGAGAPEGGFDGMVADAERELGIDLPEDLAVLLGSNFVGALHDDEVGRTQLEMGARVTTDGPRAVTVIDKLNQAAKRQGEDFSVVRRLTEDGVIVASTEAEADRLARDGGLGDRDAVRKALPDVEGATVALWVDIRGLVRGFMGNETVDENLEPVEGLGMTAQVTEDGAASYRLRLVTR